MGWGVGLARDGILPNTATMNLETSCSNLDEIMTAIEQKHPEITNWTGAQFDRDESRPHVSLINRQKSLMPGWDILPIQTYWTTLVSVDFPSYRSSKNSFNGKKFSSVVDLKNHELKLFTENLRIYGITIFLNCVK